MEHAPDLLKNMPDDVMPEPVADESDEFSITIELVQKAVAWDKQKGNSVLSIPYHILLKDIAEGRKTLNVSNMSIVRDKINVLIRRGFRRD